MRELQPFFDTVLLIPGRELTAEQGHANIFGTTEFIDYRAGGKTVPDMATMLRNARESGALISINHPGSPNDHRCRGCGWIAPPETYGQVDAIEAMNSGKLWQQLAGGDPMGDFAIWEAQVATGRRVTAIGGSDNHDADMGRLGVGFPTTVVRADELSERAILDGIKAGHVWIDLTGKPGRSFDLIARAGNRSGTIGDAFALPAGETLALALRIGGSDGASLTTLVDGKSDPSLSVETIGTGAQELPLRWTSDGGRHWIRFEVHEKGKRVLVTNPVYVNFD